MKTHTGGRGGGGAGRPRRERFEAAVDVALLSAFEGRLHALVVRRPEPAFRGAWALPGGFLGTRETLAAAARRTLADQTGRRDVFLEQLFTFDGAGSAPAPALTIAYYALVDPGRFRAIRVPAGTAAVGRVLVPWEGETGGPVALRDEKGRPMELHVGHAGTLGLAVKRIRGKLNYTPVGFQLLPEAFTLLDLQAVHETVLGRPLNKDSFRRRMLASGLLEATGERQEDVDHRPAELYRFRSRSAV